MNIISLSSYLTISWFAIGLISMLIGCSYAVFRKKSSVKQSVPPLGIGILLVVLGPISFFTILFFIKRDTA